MKLFSLTLAVERYGGKRICETVPPIHNDLVPSAKCTLADRANSKG